MVVKKLFLIFFCVIVYNLSHAQIAIGINLKFDENFLKNSFNYSQYVKNISESGVGLGIPVDYSFKKITIKTELSLLGKNYLIARTDSFKGAFYNFHNTYIQLPLIMQYKLGHKRLTECISLGVYEAYLLRRFIEGKVPDIFNLQDVINSNGQISEYYRLASFRSKYSFNSITDKRNEIGLTGSVGFYYNLNEKFKIASDLTYFYAQSTLQKQYTINQNKQANRTIALSWGIIRILSK